MTVLQSLNGEARTEFTAVAMHQGQKRPYQEDAAEVGDFYLIVADGMGGQPDGDKASRLAVEAVSQVLNAHGPENINSDLIREAFAAAQDATGAMKRRSSHPGDWPATTLLVAVSDGHGGIVGGHLGDSRAYLWSRESDLVQLTADHESIWGSITRFVGGTRDVPDIFVASPEHDDRTSQVLLLCSDGLFLDLSDTQISDEIRDHVNDNAVAESLARNLVLRAVDAGGRDNVTAGVLFL